MSRALPPLLLVRHGRTRWNRLRLVQGTTDVPLDRVGRAQADRLAHALADRPIAVIYSSPLIRARHTADCIRAQHGREPSLVVLDELRELDYGLCQGMTLGQWATVDADLERRWRTEPWRVRFPNGETLSRLRRRAGDAIARLRQRTHDPDSEVLVVAHGHILRALMLQLHGWPVERFWSIDVPNASILTVPSPPLSDAGCNPTRSRTVESDASPGAERFAGFNVALVIRGRSELRIESDGAPAGQGAPTTE